MRKLVLPLLCLTMLLFGVTANASLITETDTQSFDRVLVDEGFTRTFTFASKDNLTLDSISIDYPLTFGAVMEARYVGAGTFELNDGYLCSAAWTGIINVYVNGSVDPLYSTPLQGKLNTTASFTFSPENPREISISNILTPTTSDEFTVEFRDGQQSFVFNPAGEPITDIKVEFIVDSPSFTFDDTMPPGLAPSFSGGNVSGSVTATYSLRPTTVPEPATMALLGFGALVGLPLVKRLRRK